MIEEKRHKAIHALLMVGEKRENLSVKFLLGCDN
jgi:hypothetical protein